MNKAEIEKEIKENMKKISKDIKVGRRFLVEESDLLPYHHIIKNYQLQARLSQRIDDEKEFKDLKLELIKVERRLESNDMDDWDIALSMIRKLNKELRSKNNEKERNNFKDRV